MTEDEQWTIAELLTLASNAASEAGACFLPQVGDLQRPGGGAAK
ncbi:hypothetical protein [Arthrobacter sp. Hiyo1]|nr:hypothetical protein [Arthrobacter sp. Hiyo1]